MDVEIRPEPPDDVRAAILAALRRAGADERESPWWRAGVEVDAVDEGD